MWTSCVRARMLTAVAAVAVVAGSAFSTNALAVPSFGRQTGMACEACHTVFPELTPFGRRFKLNGYVIDNMPVVQATDEHDNKQLTLNQIPPLSVMVQASYTKMKKSIPDDTAGLVSPGNAQNGAAALPQQASLFYAGRIAPNLGGFIQLTYSNDSDGVGMDNLDLRFAKHFNLLGSDTTFGLSLNNNPTVQDVWNTTPAWQSPFDQQSNAAVAPGASAIVDGALGGQVAGLSAYLWWNDSVYAELGGYRSARAGSNASLFPKAQDGSTIDGLAPYWRLAYEHLWDRHSLSVGTFGMETKLEPGGTLPLNGVTDRYRDVGVDSQYQYIGDDNIVSAQATYINERQTLGATFGVLGGASNLENTLKTWRLGGSYFYQREWGGSLGYFSTKGTADSGLYAPGAVTGYGMNVPDSRGWRAELDFIPWENTKFALQYVVYNKFNGTSTNYDGSGRNAKDNNTLYLLGWINF
ncbi:MAG: cytochrome C [Betaproteobacteria bacterium]|nr:cytochrome C [Betaproteobacteria bacterium]